MGKMFNATKANAVTTIARAVRRHQFKKKRFVRKAVKQYSVPKNKQTHYHVRRIGTITEADFSQDVNDNLTLYYQAHTFQLDDLEGVADLTRLYDRYMITKVVLEWIWTITTPSGAGASGPNASLTPYINVIRDYDDNTLPTQTTMRESGRVIRKRLLPNRPTRIAITPAVLSPMYQTGLVNGYGPRWKQSIDMLNASVPHYGLKVQIVKPPIALGYIQCTGKYYVSCYQTR